MAAKPEELRKLKDQAAKALEKKSYAKAAELYVEIAGHDPDPDWRQRAGEALRKAGKGEPAIGQLALAAEGYASAGFLLKAIAVCKVILQIDPQHTATQSQLARLYAVRDRRGSSGEAPSATVATVAARPVPTAIPKATSSPSLTPGLLPSTPALTPSPPQPARAQAPQPKPAPRAPLEDEGMIMLSDEDVVPFAARPAEGGDPDMIDIATVGLDELAPPQLAPGAPIDSLDLRTVLPHKRSSDVIPRVRDDIALVPDASAYEIPLEDDELLELDESESPAAAAVAQPAPAPVDDELSFAAIDLALDENAVSSAATAPSPARPAAPAPAAPEESFGDLVLDDSDPGDLSDAIREAAASLDAPGNVAPAGGAPTSPRLDAPPPGGRPHATGTPPPSATRAARPSTPTAAPTGPLAAPPPGGRPHATGTPPPGARLHAAGSPPAVGKAQSATPTPRATAFAPPARPTPSAPDRPDRQDRPPVASIADELDFGSLLAAAAAASPPEPRPALPTIPLFSSLDEGELRQLIEGVAVRSLEPGDKLLREGEPGTSLFVIVRGEVEVYLDGPPRRSLARLGEGAFVGEQGLLSDSPRSASVAAITPVEVLEITRDLIANVIASSPDVLKVLLRFFRDRMIDRLLRSSALFSHFSDDDARGLVARLRFLELEPGLPVVVEGQPAPGLFILLCGTTDVSRADGKTLARLGPGDAFGEMSLLRPTRANATVTTRTKCWALQLSRSDFTEIAVTYPQVLEFVSELADRRAAASDRL